MPSSEDILKEKFGHSEFLPFQEKIIDDILNGRDTLGILATGSGKSICYQLPALLLDGITLVISPLKALMKDQVDNLKINGIPVATINSSNYEKHDEIRRRAENNEIKILFVSPERVTTDNFILFLKRLKISLIAVDEAHCISMWGHNFRPEYREIRVLRDAFLDVPVVALTATAIPEVRKDIIQQLELRDPHVYVGSFNRKNLFYYIKEKKKAKEQILQYLNENPAACGIIYCLSRKTTEEIAGFLQNNGFNAKPFHANLPEDIKQETQEDFLYGKTPVICSTVAFGMGVDKPDIRFVIHYDPPKDLESYYQETGRAGRDRENSDCIFFYSPGDFSKIRNMVYENNSGNSGHRSVAMKRINDLINFCETSCCRRKYLLSYFGEEYDEEPCPGCDNCINRSEKINGRAVANLVYNCLREMRGKSSAGQIADVLRGSKSKDILKFGRDRLNSYNKGLAYGKDELKSYIYQLVSQGYFEWTDDKYLLLSICEKSRTIEDEDTEIFLRKPNNRYIPTLQAMSEKRSEISYDTELLDNLKGLTEKISTEMRVISFNICPAVALKNMAATLPKTRDELYRIGGFSKNRVDEFGDLYLKEIAEYCRTKDNSASSGENNSGNDDKISNNLDSEIISDNTGFKTTANPEISGIDSQPENITSISSADAERAADCPPKNCGEVISGNCSMNTPEGKDRNYSLKDDTDSPQRDDSDRITYEFSETGEHWINDYLSKYEPKLLKIHKNVSDTLELLRKGYDIPAIILITGFEKETILAHIIPLIISGNHNIPDNQRDEFNSPFFPEISEIMIDALYSGTEPEELNYELSLYTLPDYYSTIITIAGRINGENFRVKNNDNHQTFRNINYRYNISNLRSALYPGVTGDFDVNSYQSLKYNGKKAFIKQLTKSGSDNTIAVLREIFHAEDNIRIKLMIIRGLNNMYSPENREFLERCISEEKDSKVISYSFSALANNDPETVRSKIMEYAAIPEIKKDVIYFMGGCSDTDTLRYLIEKLSSSDETEVSSAIKALGRRKNRSAIKSLVKISGRDERTDGEIISALGNIGSDTSAEFIERYLDSQDENLKGRAIEALISIDRRKIHEYIERYSENESEIIRKAVAYAAYGISSPELCPLFLRYAYDPSPAIRALAAEWMGKTCYILMADAVSDLMKDESVPVKRKALSAYMEYYYRYC
ncbi:RecQ family ATP-dependent DNA helicase [Methanoplanus endosymbiosus]|uniref:DNA 3'-5' helicase n=1 Tax=Methanoplanus endosymbiosus TaxID=33865 RepID=A0A9E7PMS6_9EURY|nr:RecQ family ATP-dependent DNA helicase [Methanoplanus endosymbiosus]UUX93113.1 RecQ family ATP-dependent DNA helicase [Methanoplanus endosymbiosus]